MALWPITVIGTMLAGGDSIADVGRRRAQAGTEMTCSGLCRSRWLLLPGRWWSWHTPRSGSVSAALSIYTRVFERDDQAAAELTARAIFGR